MGLTVGLVVVWCWGLGWEECLIHSTLGMASYTASQQQEEEEKEEGAWGKGAMGGGGGGGTTGQATPHLGNGAGHFRPGADPEEQALQSGAQGEAPG
jgi:hypothetical protein